MTTRILLLLVLSGCAAQQVEQMPENCSARYATSFAAHVQWIWKKMDPRCENKENK